MKDKSTSLSAQDIKSALLKAKEGDAGSTKPVERCTFAGVEGWLRKASAFSMEGYRALGQSDDPDQAKKAPSKLIQICFCDADGTPVFGKDDVGIIAGFHEDVHHPVYRAALRVNGYGREGAEEILKNLLMMVGADGLFALLASMDVQCPVCSKSTKDTSCASSGSASNSGRPAALP